MLTIPLDDFAPLGRLGWPTRERTFKRVSAEARDGYLSRAAALLASTPLAIADDATWRGLVSRCPPLGRAPRWLRIVGDDPRIHLTTKALKEAARTMKRSSALYTQPHHLRVVANAEGGASALLGVCSRVINGDVPPEAARWLTSQKVVALSKMSTSN